MGLGLSRVRLMLRARIDQRLKPSKLSPSTARLKPCPDTKAVAFTTRIEAREGRALTAQEIYDITAAHEKALARLLMLYIGTGLFFMLLPGTFLGVWNLIHISSRGAATSVSASWIQGHGQAQLFGWIGTFILGI